MFLEPSVVNPSYQRLIIDYLLANVLALENIKSVDVYFFLEKEEKKDEYRLQYTENEYKNLCKVFTNKQSKEAIHLCFIAFDERIPYILDMAIEVVIALRMPNGKFKYSFIDFFFYDELEGKSIREQGYDKVKVLNDLVEMYDLTKLSKKERNDISAEDEKISVFINDLFAIFYGYQPSNPSTLQ